MPVFDLATAEADSACSADICVVGAGMAGLFLAQHLARRGVRVVVVESGGRHFDEATHALNAMDTGSGPYARAMTNHYRGLGGTSSKWAGRTIPISDFELGPREHIGLPGWPIAAPELRTYEAEVQRLFGLGSGSFEEDALDGRDGAKLFPRGDPDFTCRWAKWPAFRRSNVATLFAGDLWRRQGPAVWLNATVTGFSLDREAGRVRTVEAGNFTGRHLSVTADEFVFAAGTIETTRLLQWLHACSDDHAFQHSSALGRFFQDHLSLQVGTVTRRNPAITNRLFAYRFSGAMRRSPHLELTPAAQAGDGAAGAFAYLTMDLGSSALARLKQTVHSLQQRRLAMAAAAGLAVHVPLIAKTAYWRLAHGQLYMPPDVVLRLHLCIEQLPDASNRMRLGEKRDGLGLPIAVLDWAPKPIDEHTLRSAMARLESYWRRSGFAALCPLDWSPFRNEPELSAHAEDYAHPSGSTRMGTGPRDSVLDPELRCHGIANVSVASASAFPSSGSANPSLTVMALALRLADRLARARRQ